MDDNNSHVAVETQAICKVNAINTVAENYVIMVEVPHDTFILILQEEEKSARMQRTEEDVEDVPVQEIETGKSLFLYRIRLGTV